MRLWLFQSDPNPTAGVALREALRQLAEGPQPRVVLSGESPPPDDLNKIPQATELDALVFCGPPPAIFSSTDWESIGLPILVGAAPNDLPAWLPIAQKATLGFVVVQAGVEQLWAALQALAAAHERERTLRETVQRSQKRLSDRITIEKAKGILQQRLGISEEQAYRQLRLQSRRQRKQIREIAQALLDSHQLLAVNGQPASPTSTESHSRNEMSAQDSAGSGH